MTVKKVGIFGGSFNPIHNGHVQIGGTMLSTLPLDEVWYVVSPHNPLKNADGLLGEDIRLRLVEKALAPYPALKACDFEFHLPRPSYTWDTLQALKRAYPDVLFTLIIGGDNWDCFYKWAHHEEILMEFDIAVFPRQQLEDTETCPDADKPLPANVRMVNVPLVNITSTMVRRMIQNNEDITPYVPEVVAKEILQHHLWEF